MHYRTLQFCIKQGLEIVEYHRILQEQKTWIKPYVDFNTRKIAEAGESDRKFLQMFHKPLVNILYGKCVQNLRKHINIHVVAVAKKLITKLTFKSSNIIRDNLVETSIPRLMLNRPVMSRFSVLELSKLHMYRYYYNIVKRKYPGSKSVLACTAIDSFS